MPASSQRLFDQKNGGDPNTDADGIETSSLQGRQRPFPFIGLGIAATLSSKPGRTKTSETKHPNVPQKRNISSDEMSLFWEHFDLRFCVVMMKMSISSEVLLSGSAKVQAMLPMIKVASRNNGFTDLLTHTL